MVQAILIKPGYWPEPVEIDPQLEKLQELVGGDIEWIRLEQDAHGYVDEDGKRKNLPYNGFATVLCDSLRAIRSDDEIVGPMLILGHKTSDEDPEGLEHDVPDWLVRRLGLTKEMR